MEPGCTTRQDSSVSSYIYFTRYVAREKVYRIRSKVKMGGPGGKTV